MEVPQMCEICSKLTTKTPGRSQPLTKMFNNFRTVFMFLLLSLKMKYRLQLRRFLRESIKFI